MAVISDFGGIFWCDWTELTRALKRFGAPFKQIVGHSPLRGDEPSLDETELAWNIDLEGIDEGNCAALVKEVDEEEWRSVVVQRHTRPASSLRRSDLEVFAMLRAASGAGRDKE